jgi:hypothetical protein
MMTGQILDFRGKPITSDEPGVDKDGNTIIITDPIGTIYLVQIWEKGVMNGVAFYSTQHQAVAVKDVLNRKYAELGVDHEAKVISAPIY